MVREVYSHNRVFRPGGLAPGTLGLLFNFTGKSGAIVGNLVDSPNIGPNPGPLRDLPSNWVIDWRRFFDFGTPSNPSLFQLNLARRLDPFIVPALHTLPGLSGPQASLAFRNLRRGVVRGLPSGQDVANAMRVAALDPHQIGSGPDGAVARQQGLLTATPLWYYILKEAEQVHQGTRLGPGGSNIVAATFLGIVHGDTESFLWKRANWTPELPSATTGTFTMKDLLNFVGDLNPVG